MGTLRQAEPDWADGFHPFSERAIVDQRGADRFDAAGLPQRIEPHEHAPAGGGSRCVVRAIHPREGIEHLEEEDEGGNKRAFGRAFAAQFHHQRCQHELMRFGPRHELTQRVGGKSDIGVGEEQIAGEFRQRRRIIHALLHGPELACPPRRQRQARNHCQPVRSRSAGRRRAANCRRIVRTLVVDEGHSEKNPDSPGSEASRGCSRSPQPHCEQALRPQHAARRRVPPALSRSSRTEARQKPPRATIR